MGDHEIVDIVENVCNDACQAAPVDLNRNPGHECSDDPRCAVGRRKHDLGSCRQEHEMPGKQGVDLADDVLHDLGCENTPPCRWIAYLGVIRHSLTAAIFVV